jgi:hypothetical protein
VRAAVALRDVVGEAEDVLVVAVVPPEREVELHALAAAPDYDRLLDQRVLGLVEMAHEGLDAPLVAHHLLERLGPTVVLQPDGDARVQEGQLAQPVLQRLQVELDELEGAQ